MITLDSFTRAYPWEKNGVTYFTNDAGERVCTGSQMGRSNILPASTHPKLHLRHVPFVDHCYDRGGAYWGSPANLFCAWDNEGTQLFLRATSRENAKAQLRISYPHASFFR